MVTGKVLKTAPDPALKSTGKEGDRRILARLANREEKAQAPEALRPTAKFASIQAITDHPYHRFRQDHTGKTFAAT
jgi:hypothetical protein